MSYNYKKWESRSKQIVDNDNQTWIKILRADVVKEFDEILNSGALHSAHLLVDRSLIEDSLFFYLNSEIIMNIERYVRFDSDKRLEYTEENLQNYNTLFNKKEYEQLKFRYFILAKMLIGSFNKSISFQNVMKYDKKKRIPLYEKADEIYEQFNTISYKTALDRALEYFPQFQVEANFIDESKKNSSIGIDRLRNGYYKYRSRKHKDSK